MSGVLRVDLDRLAANIARVREAVGPAELMLVVKDDAYGHGLDAVVRRARREGVRWIGAFDVATGAVCESCWAMRSASSRGSPPRATRRLQRWPRDSTSEWATPSCSKTSRPRPGRLTRRRACT
nr:hypothetical protein GCM10025699_26180 [Microbacterium flavescens]